MAHQVETMFWSKEVPWHGLGIGVQEAQTSDEAIRLAGLDWNVEKRFLFQHGNLDAPIPGYYANVRSTDNKTLGVVKDKYQIVQNQEAFQFVDQLLADGVVKYETAGSLFGGKLVWMLASMENHKILGDDVTPYLCFMNRHDGGGKLKVIMTPTRVVCNNTLSIALRDAKRQWATVHAGNLKQKMQEAHRTLSGASKYMESFSNEAERLAAIKIVNVNKWAEDLFSYNDGDADNIKGRAKEMREQFMVVLAGNDLSNISDNGWGLLNAASDFATHIRPGRFTSTYQEHNFNRVMIGHPVIERAYDLIKAAA